MKHRMTIRAIALFLTMVMTVGLVPASALAELLPQQPPAEQSPTEQPEGEAGSTPEPLPAQTQGEAAPLAAGEVSYLPVEGDTSFTAKPTLNARFLAGDGSDTTLPFQMTDIDYRTYKSITGTLQISLKAEGTQTNRKLEIAVPKGITISAYSAAEHITTGATVEKNGDYHTGTTLVYTLADGPSVNFTITANYDIVTDGTTYGDAYIYPGEIFKNTVAYHADENGTNKTAKVTEAGNFIVRDLPNDQIIAEHATFSANPYLSSSEMKAGYEYGNDDMGYIPFKKDGTGNEGLTDWAPVLSGFRVKLKPNNPNVQIIGCRFRSTYNGLRGVSTVSEDGGSYILTFKMNEVMKPYQSSYEQALFSMTLQNSNPSYGEQYAFTVEEYSILVPNADDQWGRACTQTTPPWEIKARMKTAPVPRETSVFASWQTLYFSNPVGLKPTDGLLLSVLGDKLDTAEFAPLVNPCLSVSLPDGLSEQTILSINESYFVGAKAELSYDNEVTWVVITPSTSDHENIIPLSKNAGGKLPTHVRLTGWVGSNNGKYSEDHRIYLKNAYGDTYRDGTEIADVDMRDITATITADNLTPSPAHTSTGTYIFREYIPPVKENRIAFDDGYSTYTGLKIYGEERGEINQCKASAKT